MKSTRFIPKLHGGKWYVWDMENKMFSHLCEYSATGVPPIRKSGTAFPRKVYRLSAKVYRLFFRL